jgi:hypothetical protein
MAQRLLRSTILQPVTGELSLTKCVSLLILRSVKEILEKRLNVVEGELCILLTRQPYQLTHSRVPQNCSKMMHFERD